MFFLVFFVMKNVISIGNNQIVPCGGATANEILVIMPSSLLPHLVIDQQLHGIVAPLNQHQFIGLARC